MYQNNKAMSANQSNLDIDACNANRKFGAPGVNQEKILERLAVSMAQGEFRNIVVLTGAGISTSSGIPDFRSPKTGLYHNLKSYNLSNAEDIFDIRFFRENPKPFYELAKTLYPIRVTGGVGETQYKPNVCHYFLSILEQKKILKRIYTQNIDGLEKAAGVPSDKIVECHGHFRSASCSLCKDAYNPHIVKDMIYAGQLPRCTKSACQGYIKPDIVFFGEDLVPRFNKRFMDCSEADLMIVMGTSLEVMPFNQIPSLVRSTCPRVLLNFNRVGPFKQNTVVTDRSNDYSIIDDIETSLKKILTCANWNQEFFDYISMVEDNGVQRMSQPESRQPSNLPSPAGNRVPRLPSSSTTTATASSPGGTETVSLLANKLMAASHLPNISRKTYWGHQQRRTVASRGFHSQSSMYRPLTSTGDRGQGSSGSAFNLKFSRLFVDSSTTPANLKSTSSLISNARRRRLHTAASLMSSSQSSDDSSEETSEDDDDD